MSRVRIVNQFFLLLLNTFWYNGKIIMKRHLKQVLTILTFLFVLFTPFGLAYAQEDTNVENDKINIYFFWGEGCPHCAGEKVFLEKFVKENPDVVIKDFNAWASRENQNLLMEFGKELSVDIRGVPFTVIGEHYIIGWLSEEYTGKQIEEAVECARSQSCPDIGAKILNEQEPKVKGQEDVQEVKEDKKEVVGIPETMDLPIIGEIETKDFSLPLLTVVLGVLDGFNPCAMWTLVFLISLLLGLKDKKRMWILGIVFIVTSAFVYFLFMAAWLNFILFIGMVTWVRIIIGLVALACGIYNLREYFVNKDADCKVTNKEKRQKVFNRLKDITHKESFLLAIGGIILLAFAVNLVEAVCSAGLPAVYTQILSLNDLNKVQYYSYILLYIFFFMLDDLIIFFIAMKTFQVTVGSKKYSRLSKLIGGILMVIIGILLIFKPELLMFG
jgi:thiol-disulfide isomerase/thioredoxin